MNPQTMFQRICAVSGIGLSPTRSSCSKQSIVNQTEPLGPRPARFGIRHCDDEEESMSPPVDAPIGMVVNPVWQWIFGLLHFGIAGLTIYLALRNPMRHRDWWEVLFRNV